MEERPKQRRGFAAMQPATQRAIASKGGRIAHERGVAHEWTHKEAQAAGRKGGAAKRDRRRAGVAAVVVVLALLASLARVQAVDPDVPGQIVTWLMDGSTIVGATMGTPPYFVAGWNQQAKASPILCDLDGDHVADVLWWNEALGVTVPWLMHADGTIKYPVVMLPALEPAWKLVGCADANADGKADLTWIYLP